MTWPGWGEVLPLVTGAVTLFAILVGGMRALTRTVAEQASAAARDAAKEAFDDLYERLRANDFRHVEERIDGTVARIDQGLLDMGARIESTVARIDQGLLVMGERIDQVEAKAHAEREAMESRLGARIDQVEAKARAEREAMESRLGARIERVEARIGERLDRMGGHMERMGDHMERMAARLRNDTAAMEARILAAVRPRSDTDDSGV